MVAETSGKGTVWLKDKTENWYQKLLYVSIFRKLWKTMKKLRIILWVVLFYSLGTSFLSYDSF